MVYIWLIVILLMDIDTPRLVLPGGLNGTNSLSRWQVCMCLSKLTYLYCTYMQPVTHPYLYAYGVLNVCPTLGGINSMEP